MYGFEMKVYFDLLVVVELVMGCCEWFDVVCCVFGYCDSFFK